jgi:rubrerythrin
MGKAILKGVMAEQAFSLQDVDFSKIEDREAVFKPAIEFEKDTILFYEMIQSFVDDQETLSLLAKIIEEENRHVQTLQEIMAGGGSGILVSIDEFSGRG